MTKEDFSIRLPELTRGYKAANDVAEQIGEISLLMIIGPSGVGKTSIIKNLSTPYVVADTTREMRENEQEGVDYFFRKDYEQIVQEIENQRFVQVAIGPSGDFYATRIDSYPKEGPAVYAVVADVVPMFRGLGFRKTFSAFIVPPSYEEWMRRWNFHGLPQQQLPGRLAEAKRSLNFAMHDDQMHFILNDILEDAVTQTHNLLIDKVDYGREEKAKEAAQQILDAIE
jgi:guanylate kinase